MFILFEALGRIEKLYDIKSRQTAAELFKMPVTTFQENRKKAKDEYDLIKSLDNEANPIKKELLEKKLSGKGRKNYSNPIIDKIVELSQKENLNLNWVFYGIGSTYVGVDAKIARVVDERSIKEYITEDYISIPYYGEIKASAGSGYQNDDVNETEYIIMPKNIVDGKNLNAIKVFGDSMSPNIKPDSIVFIDLNKIDIKTACVYVLRYRDEIFIKRLESFEDLVLLRSDNIAYTTVHAKREEVHIIGQVINSISNNSIL
ncbi:MAG: phage repressor protein C with HTH and peptisase S24 domain [Arcobacteraceae bacterium]|jgi:phage repressor protein C with HTH and peptisase S24 domain